MRLSIVNKLSHLLRLFVKDHIWSLPQETPTLFLTFDDGPIPNITPKVLDILDQYDAKATFFCVAENVKKHPDIYRMLKERGHSVGNHTYNHLNGWKTSTKDYLLNVDKAAELISSDLFRPPYGKMKTSQRKKIEGDYDIIMWDVLAGDYDQSISAERCANYIINKSTNGSIVVFHDSLKAADKMLSSLPLVLDHYSKLEYKFKTIQEGMQKNK